MFGRIRGSWSIFVGRRPGLRFRERYRLRQSKARGRSRWHPVRLLATLALVYGLYSLALGG